MRILLTGAASPLGRAITDELGEGHQLRLFDPEPIDADERHEVVTASLTDVAAVWSAVRDIDAVLHTGEPPAQLPADELARDQQLLLSLRGAQRRHRGERKTSRPSLRVYNRRGSSASLE